jgi:hypothetical protein
MSSAIVQQLNSIRLKDFNDDSERFDAKEAARALLARLETPFERAWYLVAEQPVFVAGLILLKDLGVWAKWSQLQESSPGSPRSLTEILTWTNAKVETNLLRKPAHHIASPLSTWKAPG